MSRHPFIICSPGNAFRRMLGCLFVVLVILSCKKDPTMRTDIDSIETDYTGGIFSIEVDSNAPWKVVANYGVGAGNGWIHFDRTEGESGPVHLTVVVDESQGYDRKGSVVFVLEENLYHTVPISQHGKLNREMSDLFSPAFWEFIMSRHLVHQALDRDVGKVYYSDVLNIKKLDLSGQTFDFMADLAFFERLEELNCSNCDLSVFTTPMPSLQVLICNTNQLKELDPALFPSLKKLVCRYNEFSEFDPDAFRSLEELDISGNPIRSIDISSSRLTTFCAACTPLKELVVGPSLEILTCGESEIERIDLSNAAALWTINCDRCHLKELDVSHIDPGWLDCYSNPDLHSLILPERQSQLMYLLCSSCRIEGELTVNSPVIRDVDCSDNRLSRLTITAESAPWDVTCQDNLLEELVIENTSELYELKCRNNLLTSLGILPNSIRWQLLTYEGNPGKDGVFTVFIKGDVSNYNMMVYLSSSWTWNGETVTTRTVKVD